MQSICIQLLKTFPNGFKAIVVHKCIRTSNQLGNATTTTTTVPAIAIATPVPATPGSHV